jgi:osmotically-inducible protein OsmY
MKALSTLAVLMSALLLQGCIAAAVVGTAAVGTKAATDPRTVGTQVDDGTLLRVNSAVERRTDQERSAYQRDGLSGQSAAGRPGAEYGARLACEQIAMGVEGTTEVFNEVRQGQPMVWDTSSDTWITTKYVPSCWARIR